MKSFTAISIQDHQGKVAWESILTKRKVLHTSAEKWETGLLTPCRSALDKRVVIREFK